MASTNKTTNYELSQFIETDRPAWLTDYNGDMRTIDSTMKAISDVASGASGSISELADRMSTAEGNITTNTNDIATLDARADALEAGQTSDDSRLDALEAEQIVQNTAIESNTRLGYNLARPYDSASTYAVGAYVLFQDTLYKCTTAVSTGEAFDPSKWLAIKATDEISNPVVYVPLKVTDLFSAATISLNVNGSIVANPTLRQCRIQLNKIDKLSFVNIYCDLNSTGIRINQGEYYNFDVSLTINTSSNDAYILNNKRLINIKTLAQLGAMPISPEIYAVLSNNVFNTHISGLSTYTISGTVSQETLVISILLVDE